MRAGWRLLIFVGIFAGLGFLASRIVPKIFHVEQQPSLDPVGTISDELQALIQALVTTLIMRIERRCFIPVRLFVGRLRGRPPLVSPLNWGMAVLSRRNTNPVGDAN